nr:reverse transcriptase domain-containing protein [Tanacetum cinerariifolium]
MTTSFLVPAIAPLIGFSGEIIWPLGKISQLVKIEDEEHSTSAWMNFVIVRLSSSYNEIIGRSGVKKIQVVSSTAHGMLKFPVAGGILTLKSSKIIPIECAAISRLDGQPSAGHQAIEERIKVAINPEYPEQTIMIGSTLTEESQNKLCDLLQRNLDVFAWKPTDMTGVLRNIAEHRLNIREGCTPIRQKRRGCAKVEWKAGKLEQLIAKLPTLTTPEEKEELIFYLAATKEAVSAVSMTERKAKQMPIYFVSRALRGPKVNYTSMENLVLALVHSSKRLKRYFQAHLIIVITDQPIKKVLSRPSKKNFRNHGFCLRIDRPVGFKAGLILTYPEGAEFTYALRFRFDATNNEAEYKALIAELRIAKEIGVKYLQANVDSRLVANQVNRTYVAKEADTIRYLKKVRTLTNGFRMFLIKQVPRSENKKADVLSKIASTSFAHLSKQVLVEELKEKSINKLEVLEIVEEEGDTWMTPIYEYRTEETLPAVVNKARAMQRKSQRFAMINGVLYMKSFLGPWLR